VGGATQTQVVRSGGSYSSSSTDWLLFGIPGADTGTVDVEILWQGGVTTQLKSVSRGQRLLIVEPAGDDRVRGIMLPD
jgi:hypothetical protein